MPLPGAPIYQRVLETPEGTQWKDSDLSDPKDLFRLREIYLRNFCPEVTQEDLAWAIDRGAVAVRARVYASVAEYARDAAHAAFRAVPGLRGDR